MLPARRARLTIASYSQGCTSAHEDLLVQQGATASMSSSTAMRSFPAASCARSWLTYGKYHELCIVHIGWPRSMLQQSVILRPACCVQWDTQGLLFRGSPFVCHLFHLQLHHLQRGTMSLASHYTPCNTKDYRMCVGCFAPACSAELCTWLCSSARVWCNFSFCRITTDAFSCASK